MDLLDGGRRNRWQRPLVFFPQPLLPLARVGSVPERPSRAYLPDATGPHIIGIDEVFSTTRGRTDSSLRSIPPPTPSASRRSSSPRPALPCTASQGTAAKDTNRPWHTICRRQPAPLRGGRTAITEHLGVPSCNGAAWAASSGAPSPLYLAAHPTCCGAVLSRGAYPAGAICPPAPADASTAGERLAVRPAAAMHEHPRNLFHHRRMSREGQCVHDPPVGWPPCGRSAENAELGA